MMPRTLPELVVTPVMHSDESLPGYLRRLAAANGARSVSWLPLPEGDISLPPGTSSAHRIAMTPEALAAVEELLGRRDGRLTREVWTPMESAAGRYVRLQGAAVPFDAVMSSHAQVCSACLRDEVPYGRADWDLSHVTTCSRHQCLLVDVCQRCSTLLQCNRPVLVACGRCGYDLRLASQVACTSSEVQIGDFSASLAPFLFVGSAERCLAAEDLFELVRLLATPATLFLEGKRNRALSKMPVAQRHCGVQRLAACLKGRRIMGSLVHREFSKWNQHWNGFVEPDRGDERLYRWLAGNDQLDAETCRFLAFEDRQANIAPAYVHYQGTPPRFFRRAQVVEYLRCSIEEMSAFEQEGLIHRPRRGLAYDADEVVACRRAMAARIQTATLDAAVGLPGFAEGLLSRRVLTSVRRASIGVLISTADVGAVLDRLLLRAAAVNRNVTRVTLEEALGERMTGEILAELFSRLGRALLPSFAWAAPFEWRTMSFDPCELAFLHL